VIHFFGLPRVGAKDNSKQIPDNILRSLKLVIGGLAGTMTMFSIAFENHDLNS
jgi:hypothetical protein